MYHPNFCSECGERILAAKWRWTNRQFCSSCGVRFRSGRLAAVLIASLVLLAGGFGFGSYWRRAAPPLIIQRSAFSPLADVPLMAGVGAPSGLLNKHRGSDSTAANNQLGTTAEVIYTCGARTKKGTPCLRRVHAPERCWQHKGMPAMLSQEKLLIKNAAQ